jgi:hypothetical protein
MSIEHQMFNSLKIPLDPPLEKGEDKSLSLGVG